VLHEMFRGEEGRPALWGGVVCEQTDNSLSLLHATPLLSTSPASLPSFRHPSRHWNGEETPREATPQREASTNPRACWQHPQGSRQAGGGGGLQLHRRKALPQLGQQRAASVGVVMVVLALLLLLLLLLGVVEGQHGRRAL